MIIDDLREALLGVSDAQVSLIALGFTLVGALLGFLARTWWTTDIAGNLTSTKH